MTGDASRASSLVVFACKTICRNFIVYKVLVNRKKLLIIKGKEVTVCYTRNKKVKKTQSSDKDCRQN